MSPPEVWGPAIWTLFHVLTEKINDTAYNQISPQLFHFIVRICKFLPCPDCSTDASNFLAKIKLSDYKNKTDFKNLFYLFHNRVNAKKRKPLFNYGNINIYKNYNIIPVVNNFINNYQTKGNMKLLSESFQRQWFTGYIRAFIPVINIPPQINNVITPVEEMNVEPKVVEEIIAVEDLSENSSDNVVEEEPVVVEEPVAEEPVAEEPVVEEEPIVEEEQVVVEEKISTKKSKKNKKNKK